jgi:hypothetical protein
METDILWRMQNWHEIEKNFEKLNSCHTWWHITCHAGSLEAETGES